MKDKDKERLLFEFEQLALRLGLPFSSGLFTQLVEYQKKIKKPKK